MPEVIGPNPLLEADENSLAHIMSQDPEKLTQDQKMKLIQAMRDQRALWLKEEGQGIKYKSKAAKTPKVAAKGSAADILKDLGI